MPVPEPPPVTEILLSGLRFWYVSAQARAKFTIVSEPLFSMVSLEAAELWPLDGDRWQAHKPRPRVKRTVETRMSRRPVTLGIIFCDTAVFKSSTGFLV